MKKILVPIDFTAASKFGISLAIVMGRKINANVYLLMYNTSRNVSTYEFKKAQNKSLNPQKQQSIDDLTNSPSGDVKIETVDYNLGLTKSLEKFFNTNTADFVLFGINKEEYKDHLILAEIYEKLSVFVKCPVITIIRAINFNQINDIGIEFPADHILETKNIRFLKQFEKIFNAKFHLLSVVDPLKENNSDVIRQLSEISEKSRLSLFSVNTVYNNDIVEGISFFSKKKKIDMAVIMNHKNQHINIDEIINEVTDKTNCSVFCQF